MTYYTKDFEKEARALVKQWCHDSGETEWEFIKSWIVGKRSTQIIEFMLDNESWKEIAFNKLSQENFDLLESSFETDAQTLYIAFIVIRDSILFNYFCNDVIDLDHEIFEYLDSLDTEPDTRFQDDVDNRVDDIRRSL